MALRVVICLHLLLDVHQANAFLFDVSKSDVMFVKVASRLILHLVDLSLF